MRAPMVYTTILNAGCQIFGIKYKSARERNSFIISLFAEGGSAREEDTAFICPIFTVAPTVLPQNTLIK